MKTILLALALLLGTAASASAQCKLSLTWDPNTEPDLAGYVLSWGQAPGVYTQSVSLPTTTTQHELSLPDGVYYFAVRAFNTAGLYSLYSNEVMTKLDCSVPDERRPPLRITGVVAYVIR